MKGDGWEEYKYRDAGFAISAPLMPIPAPPSPDEPNTRAYGIKYNNRSSVVFSAGPLDMWENLSDKEKLQRMKDLMLQGTVSKLVSEKEISLDGNPGIEMEIENINFHLRALLHGERQDFCPAVDGSTGRALRHRHGSDF